MKKLLIATLLVACMVTSASAQKLSYGAKVGLNVASFSSSDIDDLKSKIGFNIGATVAYSFGEKSSVSADLLFSTQGAKYSYSDSGYESETNYSVSYINIPILYNFNVFKGLSIKAGIQPGFVASAKYKYEVSYNGQSQETEGDLEISSIDFAIPIGVSYDITENIFVDARYNIGVSNILTDSDASMRNNVLSISAGYKF